MFELRHLNYLDLSYNNFVGEILSQLGTLSSLHHLDLSGNYRLSLPDHLGLESFVRLTSLNLHWLSSLSSLEFLSLGGVNVSEKNWGSIIGSLVHLKHLDLRGCSLASPTILSLPSLTYLDLCGNKISGSIPNTIAKLSSLTHLDLSWNEISGSIPNTIAKLSFLIHLDLSGNNISGSIPNTLGNLSYLTYLDLTENNISGSIPKTIAKLSSLIHLDLSHNNISGGISNTIVNMSGLEDLDLSHNALAGSLSSFSGLFSLTTLDLSYNHLSGYLPLSFAHLSSLTYLNVRGNHLNGSISSMLPSSLEELHLSNNSMNGTITESLLQKFLKLNVLDLSQSGLSINISSTWIPSFQLEELYLKKCQIGGPIPSWISTQFGLEVLDLSANQLMGNLPSWLWDIDEVYLSNNHLQGFFTPTSRPLQKFNSLENSRHLDVSMNELSGCLPADIHMLLSNAEVLILADSKFEGKIPTSIGNLTNLSFLDLSNNCLTGNIPATLGDLTSLEGLHLENNYLEGEIPEELGKLGNFSDFRSLRIGENGLGFRSLRIGKNRLQGVLPSSLRNLSSLQVLDVGENNLTGNMPHWLANFSSLHFLVMRSNNFRGHLPPEIGRMPMLQVLDLSSNLFSGTIPHSYWTFPAMQESPADGSHLSILSGDGSYSDGIDFFQSDASSSYAYDVSDSIDLIIKGLRLHYEHILSSFLSIDLSNNRLTGHLMPEIESLKGLRYLNLSMNNLNGPIPKSLGNLPQLESLDLSLNRFSGHIPSELGNITSLASLNLSFNQLDGRIPQQGGQMLTFDESSYRGNPNLWGCPLPKNCSRPVARTSPPPAGVDRKREEAFQFPWYWMCFGLSVGLGFSGVVLLLLFMHSWRTKIFELMDRVIYMLPKPKPVWR